MEGPDSGGDYRDSGQLMYFLAKKKTVLLSIHALQTAIPSFSH